MKKVYLGIIFILLLVLIGCEKGNGKNENKYISFIYNVNTYDGQKEKEKLVINDKIEFEELKKEKNI